MTPPLFFRAAKSRGRRTEADVPDGSGAPPARARANPRVKGGIDMAKKTAKGGAKKKGAKKR